LQRLTDGQLIAEALPFGACVLCLRLRAGDVTQEDPGIRSQSEGTGSLGLGRECDTGGGRQFGGRRRDVAVGQEYLPQSASQSHLHRRRR
jgi:hypothetical protein